MRFLTKTGLFGIWPKPQKTGFSRLFGRFPGKPGIWQFFRVGRGPPKSPFSGRSGCKTFHGMSCRGARHSIGCHAGGSRAQGPPQPGFCRKRGGSQNRQWGPISGIFGKSGVGRQILPKSGEVRSPKNRSGSGFFRNFRERREIFGNGSRKKSVVDRNFAKKIITDPSRNCYWRSITKNFRIVTAFSKKFLIDT